MVGAYVRERFPLQLYVPLAAFVAVAAAPRDGTWRTSRWWNLAERAAALRGGVEGDPAAWYRDAFDDAVALRRISDVPLGVLLSGGLDSGTVAASLAAQSAPGVASFTVRFAEPGYDEGPLAAEVARRWRLDSHTLQVEPADLLDRLLRAAWLNDEPLAHGNELHILAIAQEEPKSLVLLEPRGAEPVAFLDLPGRALGEVRRVPAGVGPWTP